MEGLGHGTQNSGWASVRPHFAPQPGAGGAPQASHPAPRDVQRGGGLVDRETGEKA